MLPRRHALRGTMLTPCTDEGNSWMGNPTGTPNLSIWLSPSQGKARACEDTEVYEIDVQQEKKIFLTHSALLVDGVSWDTCSTNTRDNNGATSFLGGSHRVATLGCPTTISVRCTAQHAS